MQHTLTVLSLYATWSFNVLFLIITKDASVTILIAILIIILILVIILI